MFKETIICVAFFGLAYCAELVIDKNTSNCGDTFDVPAGEEYIVKSNEADAGIDCTYKFTGDVKDNCMGLCYALQSESYFETMKANVKVDIGGHTTKFYNHYVTMAPWCSEEKDLSLTLSVADDYVLDPKNPKKTGYKFSIAVYNRCGGQGVSNSITFEEAVHNLENYHHAEEFDDTVRTTMIHGILVGVICACAFLVMLLVTWCYYKQSPNRGRSRSASTPKSFSKKMDVEKAEKKSKEEPATHYTYKKTDPEKVEHGQPENKPLLSGGASVDPEKPPYDASVDTKQ